MSPKRFFAADLLRGFRLLAAFLLAWGVMPIHAAQCAPPSAKQLPSARQYLVLGTPEHIPEMKATFGPVRPGDERMIAFSPEPLPVLTRSVVVLKKIVNEAFDVAEREDVPVAFHLDPLYAWGADLEKSPSDAPLVKYWRDPDMREWTEFPVNGRYPARIPRQWFNWGAWNSPAPAVPCLGSPKFLRFVQYQVLAGVARPMAVRVQKLDREGRGYLFAGVNVGWETCIPIVVGVDPNKLPTAVWPVESRSVTMQPWEAGAHLGYAALYWHGWNQAKLDAEAKRRGTDTQAVFNDVCWHVIHDYNAALAKLFSDQGLPRDHIDTHQVAVGTVKPGIMSTITPPIWVAVNSYSTPGFTLDNKGGAVYDLAEVKRQIKAADPAQGHFAASESYLRDYHDEKAFADILTEQFGGGCHIKWLYSAYPTGGTFGLDPKPEGETLAILHWLRSSTGCDPPLAAILHWLKGAAE